MFFEATNTHRSLHEATVVHPGDVVVGAACWTTHQGRSLPICTLEKFAGDESWD